MIRVRWADGRVTEDPEWEGLIEQVAAMEWNRAHDDMRHELVRRAYVWSGELVDPRLPADELWRALEKTGLVELEEVV